MESVGATSSGGGASIVALDLWLAGKRSCPVAVQRKRVRVETRGHIARRTRIGVVAPRAADIIAAFEHHKVAVAGPVQPDRCPHTREAAPDDGDGHMVTRSRR